MFSSIFRIGNSVENQKLMNLWVFSAWNIIPPSLLPLVFLFILLGKVLQNAMTPDSYTFQSGKLTVFTLGKAAVAHRDWDLGISAHQPRVEMKRSAR